MSGDPIFYLHTKFGENSFIGSVSEICTYKLNLKQCPLAAEFDFRFLFRHVSPTASL